MIASAATPGPGWAWIVGVVVFLGVLAVLTVDRARLTRRLAARERSEALLQTQVADTRREVDALRECLRDRAGRAAATEVPRDTAPGAPNTPVG